MRLTTSTVVRVSAALALVIAAGVGICLWPRPTAHGDWRDPATCRTCHAAQYAQWAETNHALANRPVDAAQDEATFLAAAPTLTIAKGLDGFAFPDHDARRLLQMAIGREPLVQYVSANADGRFLVTAQAFHVQTGTWFNVFGDASPSDGALVWNNQCAYCHMTGLHKRYDAQQDRYRTTWDRHGVGCNACHAGMEAHVGHARPQSTPVQPAKCTPDQPPKAMLADTCERCHARREELTAEAFQPGDSLHDHFQLELPDQPGLYYPDGQVRDEAFEGGSLLLSRMGGHGGVQCVDCHDPHTAQLRAPLAENALCLSCHATGKRGAVVIADPQAHSHHSPESTGNRCENCHMPVTVFMQRDPRRDHGFTTPDPLLTLELGIPNACNRCHADRDASWAQDAAQKWYGARLETRQRRRALAVAAAMAGTADVHDALLTLSRDEDIPAWQATLAGLLTPWAREPSVTARLGELLDAAHPLVRAAAVRALAEHPDRLRLLRRRLNDPVRLVRLDAAFALRDELHQQPGLLTQTLAAEVVAWLDPSADTAMGALRRAEWALLEKDASGVRIHAQHAVQFAPDNAEIRREATTLLRLAAPK